VSEIVMLNDESALPPPQFVVHALCSPLQELCANANVPATASNRRDFLEDGDCVGGQTMFEADGAAGNEQKNKNLPSPNDLLKPFSFPQFGQTIICMSAPRIYQPGLTSNSCTEIVRLQTKWPIL